MKVSLESSLAIREEGVRFVLEAQTDEEIQFLEDYFNHEGKAIAMAHPLLNESKFHEGKRVVIPIPDPPIENHECRACKKSRWNHSGDCQLDIPEGDPAFHVLSQCDLKEAI